MDWMAPWMAALGWTLLHFVWQGVLVGVVHAVVLHVARTFSPSYRYGASLVAMLALMLLPLITFAVLITGNEAAAPRSAETVTIGATVPGNAAAPLEVTTVLDLALPYVVFIWLAGVSLLSVRFTIALITLRNMVRRADYDGVSDWMKDELARLMSQKRLNRNVRIALSTRVNSPLVVGWIQPVIYLPLSAATGLDHQQIRLVLAHELAHLRRYDHLVNMMQVVMETLLFYHPVVHSVSRSLRQEREQCCDDMAIQVDGNRLAYARVLAELEEMRQQERSRVLALGIADQELYVRIERLVRNTGGERPRHPWLPVVLIAGAGWLSASQTLDFDAPLLPAMFERAPARQHLALELPRPTSREFVPIRAPVTEGEQAPTPSVETSIRESKPVSTSAGAEPAVPARMTTTPRAESQATTPVPLPERSTHYEVQELPAALPKESVIEGGDLIHAVEPRYPRHALFAKQEGEVIVEFTITPSGDVTNAVVLDAEPRGTFDAAALAAVRRWKYSPFTENGTPASKRVVQSLEFRLEKDQRRAAGSYSSCTGTRLCRESELKDTRVSVLND